MSQLVSANAQQTTNIHGPKMSTIPRLGINYKASNNPQLLSDSPKTSAAKDKHSSTSNPYECREDILAESKASVQA